jgi:hypothetical protein
MHRYQPFTRWLALPVTLMLLAVQPARAAEAPERMAKRLAACSSCHGDEGRTVGDDYYPAIAGKPAGYLYAQLLGCWPTCPTPISAKSRCTTPAGRMRRSRLSKARRRPSSGSANG